MTPSSHSGGRRSPRVQRETKRIRPRRSAELSCSSPSGAAATPPPSLQDRQSDGPCLLEDKLSGPSPNTDSEERQGPSKKQQQSTRGMMPTTSTALTPATAASTPTADTMEEAEHDDPIVHNTSARYSSNAGVTPRILYRYLPQYCKEGDSRTTKTLAQSPAGQVARLSTPELGGHPRPPPGDDVVGGWRLCVDGCVDRVPDLLETSSGSNSAEADLLLGPSAFQQQIVGGSSWSASSSSSRQLSPVETRRAMTTMTTTATPEMAPGGRKLFPQEEVEDEGDEDEELERCACHTPVNAGALPPPPTVHKRSSPRTSPSSFHYHPCTNGTSTRSRRRSKHYHNPQQQRLPSSFSSSRDEPLLTRSESCRYPKSSPSPAFGLSERRQSTSSAYARRSAGTIPLVSSESSFVSSSDELLSTVTPVLKSSSKSSSGGRRKHYHRRNNWGSSGTSSFRSSSHHHRRSSQKGQNGTSTPTTAFHRCLLKWFVGQGGGIILWFLLLMVGLCSISLTIVTNRTIRLAQQQAEAQGLAYPSQYRSLDHSLLLLQPGAPARLRGGGPILHGIDSTASAWTANQQPQEQQAKTTAATDSQRLKQQTFHASTATKNKKIPSSATDAEPSNPVNRKNDSSSSKTMYHEKGAIQFKPTASSNTAVEKVPVSFPVKKLTKTHSFEIHDRNLYRPTKKTAKNKTKTKAASPTATKVTDTCIRRIVVLHDSMRHATHPKRRKVHLYPPDFTDNTQLYGILDSDDERIKNTMEVRAPLAQGECVPMKEWQTTYHPTCNRMHEVDLAHPGSEQETGAEFRLFGTKGYWRNAWTVEATPGLVHGQRDTVVLKTLK